VIATINANPMANKVLHTSFLICATQEDLNEPATPIIDIIVILRWLSGLGFLLCRFAGCFALDVTLGLGLFMLGSFFNPSINGLLNRFFRDAPLCSLSDGFLNPFDSFFVSGLFLCHYETP
jgi:hypothetical protein